MASLSTEATWKNLDELFCPLRMYHGQSVRLDVGSGFNLGGGDGQRDGSDPRWSEGWFRIQIQDGQQAPAGAWGNDEVALRGQR